MTTASRTHPSLISRLLWFAGLWLTGVGAVVALAYTIRLFIS